MTTDPDIAAESPPPRSVAVIGEFTPGDGDPLYYTFLEQNLACSVTSFT